MRPLRRAVVLLLLWAILAANAAAILWLWVHGGNVTDVHSSGDVLTSIAR